MKTHIYKDGLKLKSILFIRQITGLVHIFTPKLELARWTLIKHNIY